MVDANLFLGRCVPTVAEVLEVIRPQLRLAALIGPVLEAGLIKEDAPLDPSPAGAFDEPSLILSGADQAASDVVFDAVREDALSNVKDWARDVEKVFDGETLAQLVGEALNECWNGSPSAAVLDALNKDEGVCESIGLTLAKLGSDNPNKADPVFAGMAAAYFGRV